MAYACCKLLILLFLFNQIEQVYSCSKGDLQSLLAFKRGLVDPRNRLSSWTGADCCSWQGVACNDDKPAARVVQLNLRNPAGVDDSWALGGDISMSLAQVDYLTHIDLGFNDFEGISIPTFFGSFPRLRYLNLSGTGFQGNVPAHLGNLSALRCLDLSSNEYLNVEESGWIANLNSLEYLDLSSLSFSEEFGEVLGSLRVLPFLSELHLSQCNFFDHTIPTSLSHTNFSTLSTLDLSDNYFDSSLPMWMFNISTLEILHLGGNYFRVIIPNAVTSMNSLRYIDLSNNIYVEGGGFPKNIEGICRFQSLYFPWMNITGKLSMFKGITNGCNKNTIQNLDLGGNQIRGTLPEWLGELSNLRTLRLYENRFIGSIPDTIGGLRSIEFLYMAENNLSGTIPNSFGNLSNLEYLDISGNSLEGIMTEKHFADLKSLKHLDISLNKLSLEMSHDWLPPFQLVEIRLRACKLGPGFRWWLKYQFNYSWLDMSYSEITDSVPKWFWRLSENFVRLDLSHNKIHGDIPTLARVNTSDEVYLTSAQTFSRDPYRYFLIAKARLICPITCFRDEFHQI